MLRTSARSYQVRVHMLRAGWYRSCCIRLQHSHLAIRRKAFLLRPQVINIYCLLLIHDHHIVSERPVSLHP
jgi:hypothetical protein